MKTVLLYAVTFCLGLIFAVLKLQYGTLNPTTQALLITAIALPGALAVARTLEYVLIDLVLDQRSSTETSDLLRLVLRLAVYVCAALLVLRLGLEKDITGLLATSAILSVVLGLALQPTLGNLFSGIALEVEKPIRIGDHVEVAGTLGRVRGMNWRSVVLETSDFTTAVVPNSELTNQLIEIRRAMVPTRFHILFSVPGGIPPSSVIEIGREVLRQPIRDLAQEPAGSIVLQGVEAFSGALKYDLRYCTTNVLAYKTVGSDVLVRLWYALDRANIPMTYLPGSMAPHAGGDSAGDTAAAGVPPEMVRRVESMARTNAAPGPVAGPIPSPVLGDPAMALGAIGRRWSGLEPDTRLLERVPLLAGFDPESLNALAMRARRLRFTGQEPVDLVLSGVPELRLILSGRVRVFEPIDSALWSAPEPPLPARSGDASMALSEQEIDQVADLLVRHVGPVAGVLVRNAAATNSDQPELFHQLAESIPDQEDRGHFLAQCPAPSMDFGPGVAFGAWGVACGASPAACVGKALKQTELLVLSVEHLRTCLQSEPALVDRLATSLSRAARDRTARDIAEEISRR